MHVLLLLVVLLPFYSHYTGQPVLTITPTKDWRILLVQSFTDYVPFLTATSAFRIGRRHESSQ